MNVFKALLVIGMIFAHGLQFLSPDEGVFWGFSQAMNLITFSGFFFCFGYVYNIAYGNKDIARSKKLRSILLPLLAYYVSAFAYTMIGKDDFSVYTIAKIVTTIYTPPYSEFLLAFALMSLVYWILKHYIDQYKGSKAFLVCTAAIMVTSLIPFYQLYPSIQINGELTPLDPIVGLFFGSTRVHYFPILQYSFFFLVGVHFSEKNIGFNSKVFSVCIIATTAFLAYLLFSGDLPTRFPPSFLWIIGSWLPLYLYYLASKKCSWLQSEAMVTIGENTLVYLLLSNIIFFELSDSKFESYFFAIASSLATIATITFIIECTRKPSLQSIPKNLRV